MKPLLVKGDVPRTLFKLAVPMVFGLLGIVAFNLVDTFFVSRLGTRELAALSFTFPVVMVIGSVALGIGVGASAVISRTIGEGNSNKVKELTTTSLILAAGLGVIVCVLGLVTIKPVFLLLGAKEEIIFSIGRYMRIWYAGAIMIIIPMVGNNIIRARGDMVTPSVIMLIAVFLNLVLDPLLIFGIGPFPRLELEGAAIATLIARVITFVFALYIIFRRDKMIDFNIGPLKKFADNCKVILYLGVPTAITRVIVPLSAGVITKLVSSYGPASVAGFGVASRVEFFALVVIFAVAVVIGPFVGQNCGAGEEQRVLQVISIAKKFVLIWGAFIFIVFFFSAGFIAQLFSKNAEVISTIIFYLRIVPIGYGLFGILVIETAGLIVLHKPLHSAALMMLQMLILYIPLAFLGSYLFGIIGIFGALALAYILAGLVANSIFAHISRQAIARICR